MISLSILSIVICLWGTFFVTFGEASLSSTRVQVSVPVNPVKEGSILSVHCQVWNLEEGYKVSISRHGNQGLTWDKVIVTNDDGRVFLAIRKMRDGSTVYFLSIMDIARSDEGEYSCKVVSMASTLIEVIAVDRASIAINYYPAENNPVCSPSESVAMYAGSLIALNCTSEAARPSVSLEWSRTGDGVVPKSTSIIKRGIVYSQLLFRPTVADSGAVFLCQVKSKTFPEKPYSCHIGPITVLPSNSDPVDHGLTIQEPYPTASSTELQLYTEGPGNVEAVQCQEVCASWTSSDYLQYWIRGTVTAGFFAFVFLIMVVTLVFKHRTFSQNAKQQNFRRNLRSKDDIYANIEQTFVERPHFVDRSVYMALTRREIQERNANFPVLESKSQSIFTPINNGIVQPDDCYKN